ncbi:3-keto-disaccharide hydrolase [Chitinophaga pinensis]|uniref:3-keto-alpha-glucoside-1,2-lyase/3-keto-2-hydroxy-glucal hydratase domain-containing protein n=1 Tax=Chitinophaga pinensis (strain ATCC 43595 / DSM 2588 / LMG 13176 / NBRC 15968 / NCIMB 11800 / UQM 2034) TaxID=485918 RepID=A0A979GBZ7_CHIPD|nr:DUF1080 domain-containing protein [Chitinophaga pinensis]ACU64676.1 protein of unknown function DUF1080 [Chitinophaga pinensis DSM 2588]
MKHIIPVLALSLLTLSASAQTPNTLSKKEKKAGWKLLFDGKTTQGWHTYLKTEPSAAWKVQDGALSLDQDAKKNGAPGGDLVTNDEYENYELSIEWKISEGGNSGIIFGVHEDPKLGATYLSGPEMQVLDDQKHPDGKFTKHNSGDLYDMKKSEKYAAKPVGEWNTAVIRKKDGKLTFWLNGVQTIDVTMGSDEWKTLLDNSKFKTWKAFGQYPKGHIALQDHGDQVWYRSVKIRQL